MTEENTTGTEDVGGAGQQEAGNNDATAGGQQSDTQDAAGSQEVEGLKAAAVAEREKRQAIETENQNLRDQLSIATQVKPQTAPQQTMYKAVAEKLGIDPELATPEEQGMIFETMMQVTTTQQSQQAFVNSHSDYAEVVGVQVGQNFQYAPPLRRAIKANPALANVLKDSPNAAMLAYEIARNDPQYLAEQAEKAKSDDTKAGEKAVAKIKAANQQLSLSAAKGGGNLDQAAAIAAMNDEEFRAHNEKIMEQAN